MDLMDLNSKAKKDFLNYANAVIKSRAISNVEDNFKPVHRRILYAMSELGLQSNKKHKKSARIVGDIIGKYHPHGDSSAYEAMIRLSQPWKMRYPLIDVQGNSGNILGDGPAAMRYTEAKLSVFGDLMLEGIDKNAVPFKPNYDETTTEPVLMPSVFPNILCNGNSGIAVGLSTSLVPHNLREVVDAITAYLKFKNITIEQLMKVIPGPDFPTGGTIIDSEKIAEIYRTGTGTITLRSKYNIENVKNQQHIVITEVPYLISIEDGVIEPLKKLVIEEGFDLIEDFENNSGKDGVNLRIILKKGANVYKVLETLWQNTRLQITQRVSNTVIVNGNPVVLNLKELIESYVRHRHNVITNIAKHDLEKTQKRILIVTALIKALAVIDAVIALIKEANDKSDARVKLIKFLDISEFQADAILDMKLSRINKLDGVELKAEFGDLQKKEKELFDIIENASTREEIMRKELAIMASRYADPRRTLLSNLSGNVSEGMPIEDTNVLFYANGAILATQQDLSKLDVKRKGTPLNSSAISLSIPTKTDRVLTVFTKDGTMNTVKVLTLNSENLEHGLLNSEPLMAVDFKNDKLKSYIVFVTSGGLVKKTSIEEYLNAKNGSRTTKLKGDQELIYIGMANDSDNLIILDEKATFFKVADISATSKITIGSKGIASNRAVSAAVVSDEDSILMVNKDGQGKLTKASDFVLTAKGANGQVVAEGTILLSPKSEHYFLYDGSKNYYIGSNPAVKSRTAVGSKLISTSPVSVSK